MTSYSTEQLRTWDRLYIWHPFTQMRDWESDTAPVIVAGEGSWLIDSDGNRYLDGVASMWTNVHGHSNPELNRALAEQAARIEHSTLLGLSGEQPILLAKRLVEISPEGLDRVFYSDNGSTAVEVALKMAFQYHSHQGDSRRTKFLCLQHAYHGDTIGAVSVGGIDLFHGAFRPLLFSTVQAPAPYCYRCPMGEKAPPSCNMACLGALERLMLHHREELAGMIIEPLLQGAGGMIVHPAGYLKSVRELCDRHGILLIADEVATGFGRTGRMFASEHEGVTPDIMALSKGISAGYLPLAATLATSAIYEAFLGAYSELKTFFHGHTFTGNPLACAVAIRSLELFDEQGLLDSIQPKIRRISEHLSMMTSLEHAGDLRQCGMAAGIELVAERNGRIPYPWEDKMGIKVCLEARKRGVFSRPLGNTVVVFPPLSIMPGEIDTLMEVLARSIRAVTEEQG